MSGLGTGRDAAVWIQAAKATGTATDPVSARTAPMIAKIVMDAPSERVKEGCARAVNAPLTPIRHHYRTIVREERA